MTKCPKCKFYSICGGRLNETVENCVRFKSAEQTNEEWLRSATTEELAKVFGSMLFEAWKDGLAEEMHDKRFYEDLVDFWLKQPHTL